MATILSTMKVAIKIKFMQILAQANSEQLTILPAKLKINQNIVAENHFLLRRGIKILIQLRN